MWLSLIGEPVDTEVNSIGMIWDFGDAGGLLTVLTYTVSSMLAPKGVCVVVDYLLVKGCTVICSEHEWACSMRKKEWLCVVLAM